MKLYGLIGYPLSHSYSSSYFKDKFEDEGIVNSQYQNFELPAISLLHKLIEDNQQLCGLNVTIPYKISVLPFLHLLSEETMAIGAVNTIKIKRSGNKTILEGYNTDALAFYTTLKPLLKATHKKALILGSGGAAKAAAYSLSKLNINSLFVSRMPSGNNAIGYEQLEARLEDGFNIIINASPIGMYPNIDICPNLPYHLITPEFIVYDMIYNPEYTKLLKLAEAQGAKISNGKEMLFYQAQLSWQIWQK